MGDKIFIVDCLDAIKERPRKLYEADLARHNKMWAKNPPPKYEGVFETAREAALYILDRAASSAAASEREAQRAKDRLKKCAKKFAGVLGG